MSRAEGRRHLVDGTAARRRERAPLRPALAVFMPDRLALVKGAPARAAPTSTASAPRCGRPATSTAAATARALAQRNALLGRIRAGPAGERSLDAWDAELAAAGVELIALRAEAAGAARGAVRDGRRGARARGRGDARATGRGATPRTPRRSSPSSPSAARATSRRGYSGWGPHLDELALEVGGRVDPPLRLAGPAARLAARAAVRRAPGRCSTTAAPAPLMLLDDVTSELDARRRELLVEQLAAGGQALVTATEPGHLPEPAAVGRTEIALRDGRALAAAEAA